MCNPFLILASFPGPFKKKKTGLGTRLPGVA